jgi:hypothetical protein
MKHFLWAAPLTMAAATALSLAASCSSPGACGQDGASCGTTGGGGHDAGTASSSHSSTATSTGAGGADAGSGWVPVSWAAPCPVEVATDPKAVTKPINWTQCKNGPMGCEQLVVNDTIEGSSTDFLLSTVSRQPSGYRYSVYMEWAKVGVKTLEERSVVYSASGEPTIAWRTVDPSCNLVGPGLNDQTVWIGAQFTNQQGGGDSVYAFGTYGTVAKTSSIATTKAANQGWATSDDLLLLQDLNGLHYTLFDRVTNVAGVYGGGPGYGLLFPHPVGDAVFAAYDTNHETWEGQVWTRASQKFVPLVHPAGAIIPELTSDGTTLLWIQTPPKVAPNDPTFPAGDIWTSPFAKTEADLKPTKRRAAPVVSNGVASKMNDGYYALNSGVDNIVHVYRLGDMQTWEIPMHDGAICQGVDYVDSEYVFYHTAGGSYRRAIASLGPGTPP